MYRIAILGCENSHANAFLGLVAEGKYPDVTVAGIYSAEAEAAQKLHEKYGTYVMQTSDELVGKVDGIMVTARDGACHYPFAKPYLPTGIPMFIDKPITCDGDEAVEFMREAKKYGVRLCGGSSCMYLKETQELAKAVAAGEFGRINGGNVCAPINLNNPYSGFYFYTQHLVQIMTTIFGGDVESVVASVHAPDASFIAKYRDYDITGSFPGEGYYYNAVVYGSKGMRAQELNFSKDAYHFEMDDMDALLKGGPMHQTYDEFIRPVFILNALKKSSETGKWEPVVVKNV